MGERVIVAGVGMIPFTKPGASDPYHLMGEKAARAALPLSMAAFERFPPTEMACAGTIRRSPPGSGPSKSWVLASGGSRAPICKGSVPPRATPTERQSRALAPGLIE